MKRGHVLIVNEESLPIHLKYMFVGTNAKERDRWIPLLADMYRVKKGDFIFFYIENTTGKEIKKGRFFGVFKANDNLVYHLTGNDAKNPNLPLKLIYRKRIQPYSRVYSKGVLEWIVLDKLPTYAKELIWTLIYRKMKAKRGNTMLFPWEVEKLIALIEDENQGTFMDSLNYTLDTVNFEIKESDNTLNLELENPIKISEKQLKIGEAYFQTYILQELNLNDNNFFPEIFGKNLVWIGNEVFAGCSMQRIDIFTIEKLDETNYLYRLIELKHPKSLNNIVFAPSQLEYYVNWAREDIGGHVLGAKKFNVKPLLVVLTKDFNSISPNIINEIEEINAISIVPEIWEINFDLESNQVLR